MAIRFKRIKKNNTVYYIPIKLENKKKYYWDGTIYEVERYSLGPGSWEDKKHKMYSIEGYGEVESLYYNSGRVEEFLNRDNSKWIEFNKVSELQ